MIAFYTYNTQLNHLILQKKKKKNLKSDAILSHFHAYNLYDLCSGYGGHNAALFTD